jgi:hypothetical protein
VLRKLLFEFIFFAIVCYRIVILKISFGDEEAKDGKNKCNKVYIGVRGSIGLANSSGHLAAH